MTAWHGRCGSEAHSTLHSAVIMEPPLNDSPVPSLDEEAQSQGSQVWRGHSIGCKLPNMICSIRTLMESPLIQTGRLNPWQYGHDWLRLKWIFLHSQRQEHAGTSSHMRNTYCKNVGGGKPPIGAWGTIGPKSTLTRFNQAIQGYW